ncbi:MAG: alpha/beta fold hydrolase [Gammaproteobacteria bacterium]|nr:alpha/beta fold hydrolase [Gammaproteobacteria bacterium]NND58902.1 alpha/beta fold hydrolase [Gammaproteobacteria bacterium]
MGETRFEAAPPLPDWINAEFPFSRRVFCNGPHRMHFVDEGSGPVVLLQHGNPMWSYLWRRVIARLIPGGVRVIAPDLIGLGLSSKPAATTHTLDFHANQLTALVAALQPGPLTIVGQDWGGPIVGLLAARNPDWVRGAVFANTSLSQPRKPPRVTPFHRFANIPIASDIAFRIFNFPLPVLHKVQGDPDSLGAARKRPYRWALRRFADRTAPLALARMVPTQLQHPTVALMGEVEQWATTFAGPVRLVWGMRDPILGRSLHKTRELFPQAPVTETVAGHFLQEEVPMQLAEAILGVVSSTVTAAAR